MIDAALQMCDPSMGFVDYLTNFEFWRAFTCQYANSVGFLTLGLFVYGSISVPIYLTTGSIIIPAVLLLLTGGAVMSQVAAPATTIAVIVILGAGAGALGLLYLRFSR